MIKRSYRYIKGFKLVIVHDFPSIFIDDRV